MDRMGFLNRFANFFDPSFLNRFDPVLRSKPCTAISEMLAPPKGKENRDSLEKPSILILDSFFERFWSFILDSFDVD